MKKNSFNVKGKDAIQIIKSLIKKGHATKIVVKNSSGHTILNIPSTLMAAGALLAPVLAGATAILALLTECTIEVDSSESSENKPKKPTLKLADHTDQKDKAKTEKQDT